MLHAQSCLGTLTAWDMHHWLGLTRLGNFRDAIDSSPHEVMDCVEDASLSHKSSMQGGVCSPIINARDNWNCQPSLSLTFAAASSPQNNLKPESTLHKKGLSLCPLLPAVGFDNTQSRPFLKLQWLSFFLLVSYQTWGRWGNWVAPHTWWRQTGPVGWWQKQGCGSCCKWEARSHSSSLWKESPKSCSTFDSKLYLCGSVYSILLTCQKICHCINISHPWTMPPCNVRQSFQSYYLIIQWGAGTSEEAMARHVFEGVNIYFCGFTSRWSWNPLSRLGLFCSR